ncbi:MAG: tRNA guanosine(34) transglycosylase Tgt [Myxococcales bacterium]|nr:tRNA guanosine(34) transglycosylase Tgt [Myxococcales bacterium]
MSKTSGRARRAELGTPRGSVSLPTFMPVGTQGTVKGLLPEEVASTGAGICLGNTYHLWLRPGAETVAHLGGLHRFMDWKGVILTDSGGFQVFSLARHRKLDDDGATFRSHIDGSERRLTPEESMRVQALLGSDIAMALDVCPPAGASRRDIEEAMRVTSLWARRSLDAPRPSGQARFGIVQGAIHTDLRRQHIEDIAPLAFDGMALGGLSVGEATEDMYRTLDEVAPLLPADRPRYLMGVGTPYDLLHAIGCGVDMFDCVLPTRNARNGQALTWRGRVNLRQSRHREDQGPLDPNCPCTACTRFSRAYLAHLIRANEMLGPRLVTLHNLWFYGELVARARDAIESGDYDAWARGAAARMREGDEVGR